MWVPLELMLDRKPIPCLRFSENSSQLDSCLYRKDFETIIKDRDLFWLAYCNTLISNQGRSDEFFVSKEGVNINFSGRKWIIEQAKNAIEELRKFFLEGLENRSTVEILIVNWLGNIYFKKESHIIDASKASEGYCSMWYHHFLLPALPKLAEFCGALYIEDTKDQLVKHMDGIPVSIKNVPVIRINWQEEFYLVYPVPPKVIPEQEVDKALYSLYQEQQLCDFSLTSKDGIIKVHSCLLYISGGPVLQKLLTADMKEKMDKTVSFPEYSKRTVRAFVEFIYLGGKAFSEKAISSNSKNPFDLFELFEFAHTYQIETLVNCCTNLISLFATKQDLDVLKHLVNLYDNKHLKQLCEHLSIKENTTILKV